MAAPESSFSPPSSRLEEILRVSDRFEELSDSDYDDDDDYEDMGPVEGEHELAHINYINGVTVPIKDALETKSSKAQDKTLEVLLPYLEGNPNDFPLNIFGLPKLQREKHVAFLEKGLGGYNSNYVTLDAARNWLVYWSLQGLASLGHDVSVFQQRVVDTFTVAQHPEGGYGGGHGQMAHLAPTYAAVLSLALVGGSAAYDSINRRTMWHYIGRMKQTDGGFTMAEGGEKDIRGAFCALVCISLLNLPLELPPNAPARADGMTTFLDKLGEWISRCQTYEGGISAAPGNEAHAAYAFCGLGCLSIMGSPRETLNKFLEVPLLIQWLSYRQCAPEGGFNGRPNKLVDGCYSHWTGGCWPIVEAAAGKGLWNRSALGRYILSAAQGHKGGLQDKPGIKPDAYHTCYNLAGLSAVQHVYGYDKEHGGNGQAQLGAPYFWKTVSTFEEDPVWDQDDMVEEIHPVFVVPFEAVAACRKYFEAKEGF